GGKRYMFKELELKKYNDIVDEKWKTFDDKRLCREWIRVKNEEEKGDRSNIRKLKLKEDSNFYLTNPGPEVGFELINPKRIVFIRTSTGGKLAIGIVLFLYDTGLPLLSGIQTGGGERFRDSIVLFSYKASDP
ncbi:842_t:CDS:2, partial [Funneliformis geosporum]